MSGIDPSWKPNESEAILFSERTWLNGMLISGVAFGIALVLFILAFTQLAKTTTKHNLSMRLPYLIYITLLTILGTCFIAFQAKMNELSFIDARLFPGGPEAFEVGEFSVPINVMACAVYVVTNWMADGMMIYRFMVIFRSCIRFPFWLVVVVPVLAYITSIALGVLWLIQIAALPPSLTPSTDTHISLIAPYIWMSLSLNIVITLAIVLRLVYFRWRVSRVLGPSYGTQYTSVAAIIVESAFLYSASAILFLVPFGLNNGLQNSFLQLFAEVQIIAPLLITYRVARGNAWVANTSTTLATKEQDHIEGVRFKVELNVHRDEPSPGIIFSKSESTTTDYEMAQV